MRVHSSIVIVAAVALLMVAGVDAWGPASHYWFTCNAVHGDGKNCVETHNDLISGTELPDAFIFGDFVTGAPGSLPCAGLGALHNPFFAGVMVQLALNDTMSTTNPTCYNSTGGYKNGYDASNCFNAYDFGVGFGAHVVGDAAGFLFANAYLGNGYQSPHSSHSAGDKNWVGIWPFMNAVDAMVIQTKFAAGTRCPDYVLANLSTSATDFISRANAVLIEQFPQGMYPTVSAEQVHECASQWHRVISNECHKSERLPKMNYEWEMVYSDQFGAKNGSEARANFMMAEGCAIRGIKLWQTAIQAQGSSPLTAVYETVGEFYKWFAEGKCTPMSETMAPNAMPPNRAALASLEDAAAFFHGQHIQKNEYLKNMGWIHPKN